MACEGEAFAGDRVGEAEMGGVEVQPLVRGAIEAIAKDGSG